MKTISAPRPMVIGYWVVTVILCLQMSFTAYAQLRLPQVAAMFAHLGFPAYFRVELSWAKFLAAVLLVTPVPASLLSPRSLPIGRWAMDFQCGSGPRARVCFGASRGFCGAGLQGIDTQKQTLSELYLRPSGLLRRKGPSPGGLSTHVSKARRGAPAGLPKNPPFICGTSCWAW
jgi:hypothetical protein